MNKITILLHYYFHIICERARGLDFTKIVHEGELGFKSNDYFRYSPSGDHYLKNVVQGLNISTGSAILDIGCGKGSALKIFYAAKFSKIDGLEISEKLAEIAKNNLRILKLKKTSIYNSDIINFNNYNEYNYFYLYNPFSHQIFSIFLNGLIQSLINYPREVKIIYNNPVCHEMLVQNNFKLIKKYPDRWGNGINIYINQ